MLWRRLIGGDLDRLRHETGLCKDYRLAFDRQYESAGCLTHLSLRGAHNGAGRF
jgi:hypothetical protein